MSDKQDIRLSPAAMKIHEAWCQDNGYKLQAASLKQQASSGKLDLKNKLKIKQQAVSWLPDIIVPTSSPEGARKSEKTSGKLSQDNLSC